MTELLDQSLIIKKYQNTRHQSLSISQNLSNEDCQIQSMEDASPIKWHLAHTTWFFETFILRKKVSNYRPINDEYNVLFNSYYNAIGPQFLRPNRGLITRPNLEEVIIYRKYVDEQIMQLLNSNHDQELFDLIELGLNHEQQHQELMLTDIKHAFFQNPLYPAFSPNEKSHSNQTVELEFIPFKKGIVEVGVDSNSGFAYDNESPKHQFYLAPFAIANRTVTNREFLAFLNQGGYEQSQWWLSEAWATLKKPEALKQPYYWVKKEEAWFQFTLSGLKPLNLDEPLCHISFYEASAFASWKGCRLPTEQEWEHAANQLSKQGGYMDLNGLAPQAVIKKEQGFELGHVWEWTNSSYLPYPGFKPFDGDASEYNGKFMSGQFVLRGGSCFTPKDHIRTTYRNFFPAHTAWQMSGIRLAKDV